MLRLQKTILKEKNISKSINLPIIEAREKLLLEIEANDILIIVGDTGSGKTTQVTQFIYQKFNLDRLQICCTQPRRIAAMSIAKKVSKELKCKLGHTVGYSVRFEHLNNISTKIKFEI